MKKNKKILCMVISGCVLLASAVTITGMGKMYSKAFAEGSEVSSDRDNQTPPNGTPPEGTPPNGAPSGGGKRRLTDRVVEYQGKMPVPLLLILP